MPANVQKRSKCFPAATEPQDLCRSRRRTRGGRRSGCMPRPACNGRCRTAAARLWPQELSFSKRY